MQSPRTRLDRFISHKLGIGRRAVRPILAQGRITVDGCLARDIQQPIHQFSRVTFDSRVLQNHKAQYIMMNKPVGVLSATQDQHHKTVIDLLDNIDSSKLHDSHNPNSSPERQDSSDLHIAGRLDFNSSGLLLLTNDGRWSRHLSAPENNIPKIYSVTVEEPLTEDYVHAFAEGMYFAYEAITTLPATLKIISEHIAEVSLVEGRYHQIKRMFGRFQNKVLQLHRLSIGELNLDPKLLPGQSRELSNWELNKICASGKNYSATSPSL